MAEELTKHCQACLVCLKDAQNNPEKNTMSIMSHSRYGTNRGGRREEGKHYVMAVDYTSDYWELECISSQDTCDVITAPKKIFVRWGITVQIQSDNGPQLTPQKFVYFAKEWCFTHTTSSPHYPQSNGNVESAVKIAQKILKRCADPELALLEYYNTTTENMTTSPIERLLGRSTRSTLPSHTKMGLSRAEQVSSEEKRAKRQRTRTKYNKSSKNLSPLEISEQVMLGDYQTH
ncbi:uncharacterized protein [Watersipora subatra]|uniref:uncharacterized protein n=1 Tax=Watersipora subatra TaxID=2589382 RepID=UPI00355C433B